MEGASEAARQCLCMQRGLLLWAARSSLLLAQWKAPWPAYAKAERQSKVSEMVLGKVEGQR